MKLERSGNVARGWLGGFVVDTGDAPFLLVLALIASGRVIHILSSEEIPAERDGRYLSVLLGVLV